MYKLFLAGFEIGNIYWIMLVVFTAMIIGLGVYNYIKNRNFHLDFTQTLHEVSDSIGELDHYRIENLDDVVDMMDNTPYPLLSSAAFKLKADSDRLYQKQWISDPDEVLQTEKVLTKGQYFSYTYELPIYIISTGILVSLLFLVMGLGISAERSEVNAYALIPLIAGLISAAFLSIQIKKNKDDLHRNLNYLSENIKDRVPVFRELAGTAALIESFFRYDRSMSDSVARLAGVVEDLTSNRIADKIAENVKIVMQKEVTPSIVSATDSLKTSADELEKERTSGLNKLADQYSAAVTSSMETHLQPFYQELENLATNVFESNKSVELSLEAIDKYRSESVELQNRLTKTLESLNMANRTWSENLEKIANNVEGLNTSSQRMNDMQVSTENKMNSSIQRLNDVFNSLETNLVDLNARIYEQNSDQLSKFELSNADNTALYENIRELGLAFAKQSDYLNKQNTNIQDEVKQLNDGLNASVQNFTKGINSGVIEVLDEFDNNLAEITNRLSDTTAEINDSVQNWRQELEYNSRRNSSNRSSNVKNNEQELEDNRNKEELMSFLLNDNKGDYDDR